MLIYSVDGSHLDLHIGRRADMRPWVVLLDWVGGCVRWNVVCKVKQVISGPRGVLSENTT